MNFSLVPGRLSFRHVQILLSVRGFWELIHFFKFILFSIFFLLIPTSSSLDLMRLKQLPISTEYGVKDPLMIGQYSTSFRNSLMRVQILKIKRIKMHIQLSKMQPDLVNQWGEILIHNNAWPHVARMTMLGHMLLGWYTRSSLTWDMKLCLIHHILLTFHPSTTIFQESGHFFMPPKFCSKEVETVMGLQRILVLLLAIYIWFH